MILISLNKFSNCKQLTKSKNHVNLVNLIIIIFKEESHQVKQLILIKIDFKWESQKVAKVYIMVTFFKPYY